MCSINGFIKFSLDSDIKIVSNNIENIILKAEDRGRDSFGYTYFTSMNYVSEKYLTTPTESLKEKPLNLPSITRILISNNRAEPTTEYVDKKTLQDVHPFTDSTKKFHVVHNGTIANDKELRTKYKFDTVSLIDSSVIPEVLREKWDGKNGEDLSEILRDDLVGSYALAIVNREDTNTLWLATNYKPLYMKYDPKLDTLFFSSLETYLDEEDYDTIFNNKSVKVVKPYTLLKVTKDKIEEYSLYKKDHEVQGKKKALIIASGGLDSTVCASWAKNEGYDITLLHFKYKCRAEEAENRAIKNIQKFYGCDLVEIPADFFSSVIGGSRLLNGAELVKDNQGEASAELAWEWVPARNLIFFSIATGYAEAHDIDYLILGGNLEESGSYPDNELIFQKKFNEILPHALNLQKKIEVLTPVANLMKHEIVKLGLDLGAPLDLTWSCYENGVEHCGECGPCYMRIKGFKMNKLSDMISYTFPLDWEGFKKPKLKEGSWNVE